MNRYEIFVKNDRTETEILATRALLAIAGVAAYVYASEWNYYAGLALSALLFLSSFFVKTILNRFKINRFLLFGLVALLIFVTTRSVWFAVVLAVYGFFFQMLEKRVKVEFDGTAIIIHYVFFKRPVQWDKLNNVVLKDRILTIDFKTDKLMQAEIAAESFEIDEKSFNRFCAEQLQNVSILHEPAEHLL